MKHKFDSFQEFMDGARRGGPLTNSIGRNPMTRKRLQSLILQGFGQGRDEDYIPWIRVTRGNAPRVSNHQVVVTAIHQRGLHMMSRLEYRAVRTATWLGATEIREQFPILPWANGPHPMAGLDVQRACQLPETPGLLDIAAKAGIQHGSYVGDPELPYVATTDLLIRVGTAPNDRLVFWSCKPAGVLADPKKGPRARERITLERLFAESIGAMLVVYDGNQEAGSLSANLDWLEPRKAELDDLELSLRRNSFVAAFNASASLNSAERRIAEAAAFTKMEIAEAQRHFRAAAWLGRIDVDLRAPIIMSKPLKTDGGVHKRLLQKQLLGVQA